MSNITRSSGETSADHPVGRAGRNAIHPVVSFIYHENQLLDTGAFYEWLDLFDSDGTYWVPTSVKQTDRLLQPSIALEDKMLLKLRIDRMSHAQAHSLKPAVSGIRVIQHPRLLQSGGDAMVRAECNVIYFEHQGERTVSVAGVARYALRPHAEGFRIIEKRIDLLGADGVVPNMQLFI